MATDPGYRYGNALKWIRFTTGLHYLGGAFDPEHMRDLANLAADALAGERDLPDFDESMAEAKGRGIRRYEELRGAGVIPDDETGVPEIPEQVVRVHDKAGAPVWVTVSGSPEDGLFIDLSGEPGEDGTDVSNEHKGSTDD